MATLYKLTDARGYTRRFTHWGEGITHTAQGKGTNMCSPDVIHAYEHPLLAVFMNPIHRNFQSPLL